MAKWTQRSYWKVYHGLRDEYGLSDKQARASYKALTEKLGRPAFGTDLVRHPRYTRDVVRAAVRVPRRAPPTRAPEPKPRRKVYGEYEVTVKYKSAGQVVDVTIRVRGPAGATADVIQKVVWRAALGRELTEYKVDAVDWRREYTRTTRRGTVKMEASEGSGEERDLQAFRGVLRSGKIRVAEVAED